MQTALQQLPASHASDALVAHSTVPSRAAERAPVAMPREFLSFRLGAEEYGINILTVQEIRSYEAPTRIANAPAFVLGVVNLRGVIVPIIDLRLKLGCSSAEFNDFTVVIVLSVLDRVIGVVVDSVSDVLEIQPKDIKPAPAMASAVDASHIMGMGCLRNGDEQRLLILTDIQALMQSPEMGLFNAPPTLLS
ncbi:chemotaxis protein CheW [Roseateles sp. SL47]|uniref:chemotaxis protein CheW n=1 Tax=Roseateles sp. SL47 TaxID=2995138 RepID=UPI003B63EB13